jgi:predicted HD superfamily hydrolase involved in NAD metabolism
VETSHQPCAQHVEALSALLGRKRFEHSLSVSTAAHGLAVHHAPDLAARAELAGLLHDNAKALSDDELIVAAERLDIEITPGERIMPGLLHGKVGAALLESRFGVTDQEVRQAVADHVTGRVGMGLLSLILFVADQIAADRQFEGVTELREVAQKELVRAALVVAGNKLRWAIHKGRHIELQTVAVYNDLLARVATDES